MSNNIKEIQEFVRKKVIFAAHPEAKSFEEALKLELGIGFKVIDILHQFFGKSDPQEMIMAEPYFQENYDCDPNYKYSFTHYRGHPFVQDTLSNIFNKDKYKIIGQPLTLSRIFNVFVFDDSLQFDIGTGKGYFIEWKSGDHSTTSYEWQFLNKNGSEATFQEQTQETQIAIAKLLGWQSDK